MIVVPPNMFFDSSETIPFETEQISKQILDVLISFGASSLYSNYLNNKLPEFHTRRTLGFINAIIEQRFMIPDPGESPKTIAASWIAEKEPVNKLYSSLYLQINGGYW